MNKKTKNIVTILLILLVAGIIFYPKVKPLLASNNKSASGPVAGGRGPGSGGRQILNVSGYIITPRVLSDQYISTGTLRPDEEVDLAFETSGKIININFTEGTRVRKGDLLAKINDKPLRAQLEKLLAQEKLAKAKEFRQKSLLGRDAISQESYDQIVTELQTIRADINLIRARISETELRAPFNGTIGLRSVSEGSYTTPATKIARLVKLSPIKIEFAVPEKYTNEIKAGFPIQFQLDGSNEVYKANVYAVDPKVELTTRTAIVRALYANSQEELKPGRYAYATLQLSRVEDAIAIPTEALVPEMEGEIVYLYNKGKAKVVKVEVGLRTESMIQITKGLGFGDTLLTTGILQLRQGLPVVLDTIVKN